VDYESHAAALGRIELGALLVAAGPGPPAEHALISLLALNGLRVSEAADADIEHLGLERSHRTLTSTRKGGKVATIPPTPHRMRLMTRVQVVTSRLGLFRRRSGSFAACGRTNLRGAVGGQPQAAGIPPDKISFPHALAAATDTVAAFPPDQLDLALVAFLLKILMPGFFVRRRPGRASPRKTKKAGDFPARKPGEPSVTTVTRRIELHLLQPWHVT
jgi:hypothetical protein